VRLLYVCSDWGIPPDGTKGASIHLRAITRALSDLGHDVRLLSPKGVPGNGHPARPVLTEKCEIAKEAGRLLREWLGLRGLPEGFGREVRPLLYNAWACERVIDALRSDPPDAIIERLSLFGHLGLDVAEAFGIPHIIEMNAPLAKEASRFRSLQLQSLAQEIEQRVLRRADRITVVSRQLGDLLVAEGLCGAKIEVIPNGVDRGVFERLNVRERVRNRLGVNGDFVVGFAGSVKPWHGVDVLADAFAQAVGGDEQSRLLIVGTGPAAAELHSRVDRLGLTKQTIFTGAVPHDEVPGLLSAMDVAAAPFLPSDDFYFSPIKLFEYMAAGTCVVASEIGQIADVIDDGVDGFLCAPGDVAALACRIRDLRASASRRETTARRAREKALTSYTWEHAAHRVEGVVASEIAGRSEIHAIEPLTPIPGCI